MGKKDKKRAKKSSPPLAVKQKEIRPVKQPSVVWWLLGAVLITAVIFFPMLNNEFTNWDDEHYVINNTLLRGPDWQGIFTTPVVSNYHPLTIISLAINYYISELDPFSYLFFNYILHLLNTILVFYFIYHISNKKIWIAFFTSLIFGIHPMHVESVAWVAERKDVLYTLFFLLALIQYWRYLQTGKRGNYWFSLFLFVLSLLSKPAATILPLVLLLLDYWKGRSFSKKVIWEKIPFLIAAIVIGVITIKIQSRGAIAGFDQYPLWIRPFFASYTLMIYFIRFFVPYPLSAFHPYPSPDDPGLAILFSPLFVIALLVFIWYKRKNKIVVFGFLFFIINLLLVFQFLSIGFTIVSERYTYVPYIGLAFVVGMWLYGMKNKYSASVKRFVPVGAALIFGFITFNRVEIWKNSGALWTDVINRFPDALIPRTNRALYTAKLLTDPAYQSKKDSLVREALADCNHAISVDNNYAAAYEKRGMLHLHNQDNDKAMEDATTLIRLQPDNNMGYYMRGTVYMRINDPEKALADYDRSISLKSNYDFVLNNRGTVLVNSFQRYQEALDDFNKAISLKPATGNYYFNRAVCYYKMGEMGKAKADALKAMQLGEVIPNEFKSMLKL